MNTIKFKYHNFWCGTISLVPIIFILAKLEFDLARYFFKQPNNIIFIFTSIIVTFVFAYLFFRCTIKIFLKTGTAQITHNNIIFDFHNRKISINLNTIKSVEINEINIYGVKMAKFKLQFARDEKNCNIVLYSNNLKNSKINNCDLYLLYKCIK